MENVKTILGILVIFIGLPLFICWLNDKLFHRNLSREKQDEYSKRFVERLLNADFAAWEAHFGCVMPEELKRLYADKEEIIRGEFDVLIKPATDDLPGSWTVAFYEPADKEAIRDGSPDCKEYFAFANDGCGNEYLVDPRIPGSEVLFYDHEGGEFSRLGVNLTEFLAAPRKSSDE